MSKHPFVPPPPPPPPDNVVPIRPPRAIRRQSEEKWGAEAMDIGFVILPSLLFRAQQRLGLSGVQLALILQIAEFWWHADKLPWPKKETLAERMGISAKQVQRIVGELEKAGYLKRGRRFMRFGQTSNSYDLSGLVAKLKELAPEFAAAKAAKSKVEKRGGLKKKFA